MKTSHEIELAKRFFFSNLLGFSLRRNCFFYYFSRSIYGLLKKILTSVVIYVCRLLPILAAECATDVRPDLLNVTNNHNGRASDDDRPSSFPITSAFYMYFEFLTTSERKWLAIQKYFSGFLMKSCENVPNRNTPSLIE